MILTPLLIHRHWPSDHRLCWGEDCWVWGHDAGHLQNVCISGHARSDTGNSTHGRYSVAASSVVCTYLFPSNIEQYSFLIVLRWNNSTLLSSIYLELNKLFSITGLWSINLTWFSLVLQVVTQFYETMSYLDN